MSLALPRPAGAPRALPEALLSCVRTLGLDAPLVALVWQAYLARALGVSLSPAHVLSLAAATWLSYVADRLLDGLRLEEQGFAPERHVAAIRHRRGFAAAWGLVALLAGVVALVYLPAPARNAGLALLALVSVYFAISHAFPGSARRALPRELVVSVVFTLGVALFPLCEAPRSTWPNAFWPLAALLAASFMNLWAVACWEHGDDERRGEVTLLTGRAWLDRLFTWACLFVALGTLALSSMAEVPSSAAPVLATSLLLLAILRPLPLSPDAKPVLADLALLTPLFFAA